MKLHDPDKFVYKSYSKNFRDLFIKEKRKLKKFLPKNIKIEHIGSTAVPEMGGKGIIDIMIITNKKELKKILDLIKKNGYNYYGDGKNNRERKFFDKLYRYRGKKRFVHVHLTFKGSSEVKKILALRDYLITHPDEVSKYAEIKKKVTKYSKGNRDKYLNYKKKFLEKLNTKALKAT